jgi:hypothetical protein
MTDKQIDIMRKLMTKKEKSRDDLRKIYELLSFTPLNDNFFKLILAVGKNEEFILDICRDFKYKFFSKGEVIFEEGDTQTEYLYFIVRGKVGVFIKSMFQVALEKSKPIEAPEIAQS